MSTLLVGPSQLDLSSRLAKYHLVKAFEDTLSTEQIKSDVKPVRKGHFRNATPAAYLNRKFDELGWDKAAVGHHEHPLFCPGEVKAKLGCNAHFEDAVKGAGVEITFAPDGYPTPV